MDKFFVKRARNGYMVFEKCGTRTERYVCSCDTKGVAELIAKLLNEDYDKFEKSKRDTTESQTNISE